MSSDLFDEENELPNSRARARLDALVGLDETKSALAKRAAMILDPGSLSQWSISRYGRVLPLVEALASQAPLFILSGDVGTGKSTLAQTFGQQVADERGVEVTVMKLSLRARGGGIVGEITKLIGDAFDEVIRRGRSFDEGGAIVFVIDEADALAQSRELSQMHHEDRAGVNALIRGIDAIAVEQIPVVIVMCTNRLGAIDPAVRRRAAAEFEFNRPDQAARRLLFDKALAGVNLTADDLERFACLTGAPDGGVGHTYSDIRLRILPAAALNAYPDAELTPELIIKAIEGNPPTPPFISQ